MATKPLSRQRILKAAFAHADKNGLEALTMRGVAARLGVEAMSLYHHVPSKRAMLDGLVDLLVQVAALPTGDITAEEWIRGAADGLRCLAQKHPRLVPLFTTRAVPLNDARSALPFEAGLSAFSRAGYDLIEGFAALQVVAVSLLAMAQLEATATLDEDAQQHSDQQTDVDHLPVADFPLLHQALATPAGLDEFWSVLVEALVRGLPDRS